MRPPFFNAFDMIVAIVGSRSITDKKFIYEKLDQLFEKEMPEMIVSGGCTGPDSIAVAWGREHNISIQEFIPNWRRDGKIAGIIRNTLIINAADSVIAFWDGASRGTLDSINKAKKQNKHVEIFSL